MAYSGARGETANEIEKALHLETLKERAYPAFHDILKKMIDGSDYELYLANQVWVPNGTNLDDQFVDINHRFYRSSPREVDFAGGAAKNVISDWISNETHGGLKIFLRISDFTLLSHQCIYFKGTWVDQFDPKKTQEDNFKLLSGKTIQIPMMNRSKCTFQYVDGGEFQILEMPYEGDVMSMVILLPREGTDFHGFEKQLTWTKLKGWVDKLKKTESIMLQFRNSLLRKIWDVAEVVRNLGIKEAFSNQADFSGVTGSDNDFRLQGINQKVYVMVNEEGTEAYSVTTGWSLGRGGPPPVQFICDHPFIFMIRHMKTGTILFIGRVMKP